MTENEYCPQHGYPVPCHKCDFGTKVMSAEWWKETDLIYRDSKSRIEHLNNKKDDLILEIQSLQRLCDFIDSLREGK